MEKPEKPPKRRKKKKSLGDRATETGLKTGTLAMALQASHEAVKGCRNLTDFMCPEHGADCKGYGPEPREPKRPFCQTIFRKILADGMEARAAGERIVTKGSWGITLGSCSEWVADESLKMINKCKEGAKFASKLNSTNWLERKE